MSTTTPISSARLLLTGAAGGLGRVLRPRLRARCALLRLSDVAPMEAAGPGEEVVEARLEDRAGVHALLESMDAVVHLGGISTEQPFDAILQANIVGTYNLYEAARQQGVRRIVFASSNHVTGFYRQDEVVDPTMPVRPDGYYGLSKAFGENLSRFYWDRYGIETVCLRIGSSFPEPKDRRMLASWLSYDDLERLVVASLTAPVAGHAIVARRRRVGHGRGDDPDDEEGGLPRRLRGERDDARGAGGGADADQPQHDHLHAGRGRQGLDRGADPGGPAAGGDPDRLQPGSGLPGGGQARLLFLPICMQFGMTPVQFGMVLLINCALGLNTPPVGTVQFIGCTIGGVSVGHVMRTIWPFYGALIVALLIVTYVPAFSMWLPNLVLG